MVLLVSLLGIGAIHLLGKLSRLALKFCVKALLRLLPKFTLDGLVSTLFYLALRLAATAILLTAFLALAWLFMKGLAYGCLSLFCWITQLGRVYGPTVCYALTRPLVNASLASCKVLYDILRALHADNQKLVLATYDPCSEALKSFGSFIGTVLKTRLQENLALADALLESAHQYRERVHQTSTSCPVSLVFRSCGPPKSHLLSDRSRRIPEGTLRRDRMAQVHAVAFLKHFLSLKKSPSPPAPLP